jgi:argininosuccinate lyase
MLARQSIISAEDASSILRGLRTVAEELAVGQLDLSPSWEDVHTRVEGRLGELIGEPAGRLHTARSRNDQVALDLRMFAREAQLAAVEQLAAVQDALVNLAAAYPDLLMPGYTHLQHAQPVLFAHHLLAYVEMFQRDAERLLDCYRRTDVLPLGSGALAGVPYPIDREEVARLLGFSAITVNSLDAVADRDFVVEHLAALALIAAHLSRLAEELVLWSTTEFGFVEIGEGFATGSSIMPQKRNPDTAELIRGKSGRMIGHLVALLTVVKGLPLAYNKDLQEDKEALFDAVDTVHACLFVLSEMLPTIQPRTERMERAAGADFSTATDYADYLAKRGMPFRQAHGIVGHLVRHCVERGCELWELSLDDLREFSPRFEADIVGLTARDVASARDVPGGTAPSRVAGALQAAQSRLNALRDELAERRDRLPSLDSLLDG